MDEKEQGLRGNPDEESENLDFLQPKEKRFQVELDSAPVRGKFNLAKIFMVIIIAILIIAVLASLYLVFFN